MRILVVAPHPDDEVLGCGGSLARHSNEGDEITLCIVTKAYRPDWSAKYLRERPGEIKSSCKILGIEKIVELEFPTVKLDSVPQKELNDSLKNIVEVTDPDRVYMPSATDLNLDHRLVFEATLVASRPVNGKSTTLMSYETPSETEWGRPLGLFTPNYYIDISNTFNAKINALKAYKSQLKGFPHPRSIKAVEALAVIRGCECGCARAEAFSLIRAMEGYR
jgi:LmbE family N-acetylglucosaminyl deacetylase